ncbi:hypothetical protein MWU78_15425 [Arenibacter sp. F26102]|uniref:hypothetical protein n=1 Tax=Arenibacter sp. F26102 TaxID=2926416 RepID=UPI001FF11794|nr:hypothetical protein [Arenibacter sp. F26102]MCK0147046.1 hypothetical protein [Arenibacter sp. F26102]
MALFTEAMVQGDVIKIFNHREMERVFNDIDYITEGDVRILEIETTLRIRVQENYKIFNIDNNKSVRLTTSLKP